MIFYYTFMFIPVFLFYLSFSLSTKPNLFLITGISSSLTSNGESVFVATNPAVMF